MTALSRLIIGTEAPAIWLIVAANHNAVIRSSSCELDAGDGRDRKGYKLCCALAAIIVADLILGKSCRIDAHLIIVATAKSETSTILGDCHGVETSTSDFDYFVVRTCKVRDLGRDMDDVRAAALSLNVSARLSMTVQTPGPDLVFVINRESVVISACNVADFLTAHAERCGNYGVGLVAFNGSVSKLTLCVCSPTEGMAINVYGKGAIGTTGNSLNLTQMLEKNRSSLDFGVGGKSKDTLAILR